MVNRMMENMNAFMRSHELQQLGIEAQRTIEQRFETMQKLMKVEEDYRQWQIAGNRFFEKYWSYTDPSKSFSAGETQAAIEAFQDRDQDNTCAQLAEAILLANQGSYSESKQLLDPLAEAPSPLQPIAWMAKAYVLEGMDKDRDSKLAMQTSLKIDRTNPYCRWIRARLACKQDQINIAETEWKALTNVPAMQQDAKRAVTLATEAHQADTQPNWYSHFVLAVALHAANKKEESLEELVSAKKLAAEDRQEVCDKLKEAIENQMPFGLEL
jgi:hypothetical protein